jgi:cytochrome b subunit of formate dehydrogenase
MLPAGASLTEPMHIPILSYLRFCLLVLLLMPATALRAGSNADCLNCHGDKSMSTERGGKTVSLYVSAETFGHSVHSGLECVSCHEGYSAENVPHTAKPRKVDCTSCHSDFAGVHRFHPQLAAAIAKHEEPDVACVDCHGNHAIASPKDSASRFYGLRAVNSCGECHSDVKDQFLASAHGEAIRNGIGSAPNCLTCHRTELVASSAVPDSLDHIKIRQEKLCLSCHLDNPDVSKLTGPSSKFIASYEISVHGAALLRGNGKAANCVDCHGSHQMQKGLDSRASVNKIHIPETCAKCHEAIAKDYRESVHGVALAKGNLDAPSCTNCHGEHTILKHNDPKSPVASANLSQQVCAPCHSSIMLSNKYDFNSDRFKTYTDSYHGLAVKGGSVEAANCASCHGAHNIKPSSDPTSTINKANLAATCGKCHPGANQRFTVGSVHVNIATTDEPILYYTATGYIILIVLTIGGMLFHNLADFLRKSKRKLMARRGMIAHHQHGHGLYVRMTLGERLQHAALLISFISLVVTGFMLRFPEAWWVQGIRELSTSVFIFRSIIHRIAAVAMIAASLYHIWYCAATVRGRELITDLMPVKKDLTDAIGVMKYNLGFSAVKPMFGRFSYIEKSEYWALVWGTMVMGATGFIMWFDNTFIGLFSKLGYDIARTVHYYEAWLATLAIIVWHFYFVIFNPDIYPINLAFWKGTITEEEMADEHPLELEKLRDNSAAPAEGDDDESDPAPRKDTTA